MLKNDSTLFRSCVCLIEIEVKSPQISSNFKKFLNNKTKYLEDMYGSKRFRMYLLLKWSTCESAHT